MFYNDEQVFAIRTKKINFFKEIYFMLFLHGT